MPNTETKQAIVLSSISAFIASLCCFSPLILVLLGLASASTAGSLADVFYGEWKWVFRSAGLLFLVAAFAVWYRQRAQHCPLDQHSKLRQQMLNLFLISLSIALVMYVVWLYGIIEWLGIALQVW